MADSLILDWLYENNKRAYPFVEAISRTSGTYTLSDGVIVDAQITSTQPLVGLTNLQATNTQIIATISGGETFTVDKTQVFPFAQRNSNGNLLVFGKDAPNVPVGSYGFTNVLFEPSVVFEFSAEWLGVTSLTFSNNSALTGVVYFLNGFQFEVQTTSSSVLFFVGGIYGTPISCNTFGSASSDCSTLISFINGVGPDGNNVLKLQAGEGTVVFDDPPNHRIYVGLSFSPGDVCQNIVANPAV